MKIKSKPVDENNFNKFGKIVKDPAGSPTSQAVDYKFWSDIANYKIDGETEVGICKVYAQPVNKITGMERHMLTPEILIPIDAPFALPVLINGRPEDEIESFIVKPGEVVIINNNVWHGACLPVGKKESSYFVIFRRMTPHEDVEKKEISPVELEIEI